MAVHTCNPNTWEAEEADVNLNYAASSYLKKQKTNRKKKQNIILSEKNPDIKVYMLYDSIFCI